GGEGSAVLPGVVHIHRDVQLGSGGVGPLDIAVAETAAGGVGAAAAAGEAQLGEAVHHGGVAGQITGLLLHEGDTGHVGQDVALHLGIGVVIQGVTVDEDELGVGEVNGSLTQSGLLQVTGTDDHVGAGVHSGLHSLVAVVIGGLIAAGGLVILVAQAIGGGVELHAVICTLVEALVLQLAHIGDEGNLVLAILAGHA